MSRRDDRITILQMADRLREIVDLAYGDTVGGAEELRMRELALARLVTILGRLARRVSPEWRQAHAAVPWQEMERLGSHALEEYDRIDCDALSRFARETAPALVRFLETFRTVG
jgi:uncharacterized protein with HEPN domain